MSRGRRKIKEKEIDNQQLVYSFCEGACSDTFKKRSAKCSEKVSSFFSNSLESISDVDKHAVQSALNFVHTWYALNKEPEQYVLNLIVFAILKFPDFTPHLTVLLKYFENDDWLYYSLRYSLKKDNNIVKTSIKENHPIWYIFVDKIAKDVSKKRNTFKSQFQSRSVRCIIEVFVLFWADTSCGFAPADKAKSFINFCIEANNHTAHQLLSNMLLLFPDDFDQENYQQYISSAEFTDYKSHYDGNTGKIII
ncbi:hypothetical protein TVAG_099850 [Trichomonas vaginalis G3]|uniref:Uncharacterized protein n=1 Tax=Trichomonas vaginalis (strain ATCC PRA-98 / G3) TaxID=412133 RepID=A2EK52_TRIV3|nr:hypothetical protein TVAGG3_0838220 [Trichomonas vaginalis G3]EAY06945.1 hypothetical protein TVAG_099850 [Trichomonas vaginalis G3]KAI5499096.1 hypothetical protein TVAGG3_0838220 [Trichomonas vaginalis G3]|eukprot:XP_001319168.1 hypothetical protein [Trichomonas vaginalis G3]